MTLRHRDASGATRRWTIREIAQGKPLGHPSHALLVHFPVAFYVAVLAFDVMTLVTPSPGLTRAGTFLVVGALGATVPAAATGLIDWWGMVPGSRKRRAATTHMLVQVAGAAWFALDLAIRWGTRSRPQAPAAWIDVEALGLATVFAGQFLGGRLVYEMGMRVSTGRQSS